MKLKRSEKIEQKEKNLWIVYASCNVGERILRGEIRKFIHENEKI